MRKEFLEEFYEKVILVQFMDMGTSVVWTKHETIGPDDEAHYFTLGSETYVLIFRDYGTFNDDEIVELIDLPNKKFSYIFQPDSQNGKYSTFAFTPPTPFKYTHNVTGYFTLIEVL